jgi:hypothetical protein
MDLQEILTEVGEEKAAIINAAISMAADKEKKLGIEASKKKGVENTKLLDKLAKIQNATKEVLGIDDLGDDPVETIKQKITELKTEKADPAKDGDAIKALETRFQKTIADLKTGFQTQIAEKEKAAEQAQTKFRNAKITSQLSDVMNGKIRGHDFIIENWINKGKVKLDENEKVVFVGEDETEVVESKKYLESFAKERSDLVISQQVPGGGSAGNRVDVSKVKQISMDQFTKLSIDDQNAFKKGGGNIIDQQ